MPAPGSPTCPRDHPTETQKVPTGMPSAVLPDTIQPVQPAPAVPAAPAAIPAAPAAAPIVRLPLRLVLLLGALTAVPSLSLDFYLPGLPGIARGFGADQAVAQLTMTACLAGFALGLLVAGPLSDAYGRRRPLLVGIAVYALASLGCALAPTMPALISFRLLQGAAGAFGMVTGNAIVRDRASGPAAARLFSVLMLANGAAPILGPVLGAQLLTVVGWRWLFGVLALLGVGMVFASARGLPETLPPERRRASGLAASLATFGFLVRDRVLIGYTLGRALGAAALLAYVSASPFVFQDIYGLSARGYSLVFGINSAGLILMGQVGGRLAGRLGSAVLLRAGSAVCAGGSVALVLALLLHAPLPLVLPGVFAVVAGMGLVFPNSTALGLTRHGNAAGATTALMGVIQFALQAVASPLTGLGGGHSALPMALVVLVLDVGGLLTLLWLVPGLRGGARAGVARRAAAPG